MPARIEPQLATATARPPADGDWLYEIKFDGYRLMPRIDRKDVRLFTRGGHDWTGKLPRLAQALGDLVATEVWLDGEIVVLDENGRPDFSKLQNAFDVRSTTAITFFAFDLLWLNGVDLRRAPLRDRRRELERIVRPVQGPLLRVSDVFPHDPASLLASARALRLESIMGKRANTPYRSGRSTDWVKLKAALRQEFVVGGFTRPRGATTGVRSLLLGVYGAEGRLNYAGSVQPHFSDSQATAFFARASAGHRPCAFRPPPPSLKYGRDYYWMSPTMVCEASFLEWTRANQIRHASFIAFRNDKLATDVVRESLIDC